MMDDNNFMEIGKKLQYMALPLPVIQTLTRNDQSSLEKVLDNLAGAIDEFVIAVINGFGSPEFHAAVAAMEALQKAIDDQKPKRRPTRQPVQPDLRMSRGKGGKMRWRRE